MCGCPPETEMELFSGFLLGTSGKFLFKKSFALFRHVTLMLLHVLKVWHHIRHGCNGLTTWATHKSMLAHVGVHALLWSTRGWDVPWEPAPWYHHQGWPLSRLWIVGWKGSWLWRMSGVHLL